jgi:hypothetical protein
MRHVRLASAVVLILVASAEANAQGAIDTREAIDRRSRSGDRLTIDTRQGGTLEGRLVNSTADELMLDIEGRARSVRFDEIARVRRRRNGILLGAIVGLGAGLTFGIPVRMLVNNETGDGNSALLTMVGIGVGTGVLVDGLLSVNRTIYRRSDTSVRFGVLPTIGGAAIRVTARW